MFPIQEEEELPLAWDGLSHQEDPLEWDHSTSPLELVHSEDRETVLEATLEQRNIFSNADDDSITSLDYQDEDSVFNDPSILEASIEGVGKLTRKHAFRDEESNHERLLDDTRETINENEDIG